MAYVQKPLLNAYADLSSMARGLFFCLSLHLHPYFVYASSEKSGESSLLNTLSIFKIACFLLCSILTIQISLDFVMSLLIFTLIMFNLDISCFGNHEDPDQLASEEAS